MFSFSHAAPSFVSSSLVITLYFPFLCLLCPTIIPALLILIHRTQWKQAVVSSASSLASLWKDLSHMAVTQSPRAKSLLPYCSFFHYYNITAVLCWEHFTFPFLAVFIVAENEKSSGWSQSHAQPETVIYHPSTAFVTQLCPVCCVTRNSVSKLSNNQENSLFELVSYLAKHWAFFLSLFTICRHPGLVCHKQSRAESHDSNAQGKDFFTGLPWNLLLAWYVVGNTHRLKFMTSN